MLYYFKIEKRSFCIGVGAGKVDFVLRGNSEPSTGSLAETGVRAFEGSGMRILIAGAGGFIGGRIAAELRAAGLADDIPDEEDLNGHIRRLWFRG